MTAIVGMVHDGHVYLGGDSAGVAGYVVRHRKDPKVFRSGGAVFGFTTSFRMGDILRWHLTVPHRHPDVDLDRWMRTEFVGAVRAALKEQGWTKVESSREEGGTFLVGIEGRLFQVDSDFQVGESRDGFDAVGCGDELALGALFASTGAPIERLGVALRAAARYSTGVSEPFEFVSTAEASWPLPVDETASDEKPGFREGQRVVVSKPIPREGWVGEPPPVGYVGTVERVHVHYVLVAFDGTEFTFGMDSPHLAALQPAPDQDAHDGA